MCAGECGEREIKHGEYRELLRRGKHAPGRWTTIGERGKLLPAAVTVPDAARETREALRGAQAARSITQHARRSTSRDSVQTLFRPLQYYGIRM